MKIWDLNKSEEIEQPKEINNPVEVPTDKFNTFILYNIKSTRTILNLIEKQSKEIENNGYHLGFIDGGIAKRYEYEDKIKAKIDEVDKDENASIPDFMKYAKEYAKQKLQSLLEKE